MHWGAVRPDAIVLVFRRTPLRAQYPDETHRRIDAAYRALAKEQPGPHRLHVVEDEGVPERLVEQILGSLTEVLAKPNRDVRPGPRSRDFRGGKSHRDIQMDLLSLGHPHDSSALLATPPYIFSRLSPAVPTEVYDTYWRFACERQEIFFRKIDGETPPWSRDPILQRYKFTNAYRASDRVSQFLISNVIYRGDQTPDEVFFRTILFKLFNRIETWEVLERELGEIRWADYSFERYDDVLTKVLASGSRIYSGAYIMPPARLYGLAKKHRNYLRLLETMVNDEISFRVMEARSMRRVFEILRGYPVIGDFLGYQFATDLNYSELLSFSEMEFVVPGPGALDGIRKCFRSLGGLNAVDIIRLMTDRQASEFERFGLPFRSLWGRHLQLIDCQNLFCEVSKYARIAHPHIKGSTDRTRIKQHYRPHPQPIHYWYPPKWGLNRFLAARA